MQKENPPVTRRELMTVFCDEASYRLKRVLACLADDGQACDYDEIHQQFDSLLGSARAVDLAWLERDSRVLAAYARFMRNMGADNIPEGSMLMLDEVTRELSTMCNRISVDDLMIGKRPEGRIVELMSHLESDLKQRLSLEPEPTAKSESTKLVVLLVDDSATSRLLFRAHIPEGYQIDIHEASEGEAAVSLALEVAPDLVVMDYNMPEQNGVTIASSMQAAGVRTRFVLLTANVQKAVLEAAQETGFSSVVEKPVTRDKIRGMFQGEHK
jgi:two-component system, chemotaxis family, chemotaxis protein CheY